MGKDEGERGHQTGNRNEVRTKAMRDTKKKALSIVQAEHMVQNLDVKEYKEAVKERSKRKRKDDYLLWERKMQHQPNCLEMKIGMICSPRMLL